jgi:hypothetical protein
MKTVYIFTTFDPFTENHHTNTEGRTNMSNYNTIILWAGTENITDREFWWRFNYGETICGDNAEPREIKRWNIEEEAEAKAELAKLRCTYGGCDHNVHEIKEYALEYCLCNEEGEFMMGSDFDFAEKAMWYAVLAGRDDDDWGYGSYDLEEAKMICRYFPEGYIAVIDEGKNPVCVEEIYQDEF